MARPVRVGRRSYRDIEDAAAYYVTHGGDAVADRFLRAVEEALSLVGTHPQAGSMQWAFELELPGLRHMPLEGFPYVLFYMEQDGDVRIWRLLHARRDIAAALHPPE